MAPRALLLLLLLLPPLLRGSAGRPAPPRAPRHSDGIFTSELSRLRERAQLQRLIQELVGKRSEQDAENGTSSTGSAGEAVDVPLFVLWSQSPLLYGWLRDPPNEVWSPGLHLGLESAVPAETQRRS